jgi:hypothetical protein
MSLQRERERERERVCGGANVDLRVEEEERCGVDSTMYTGAAATAWTRQQWRWSGR